MAKDQKIRQQRTIKKEVTFSGMGLHTGLDVSLKLLPAKEDSGIVFRRIDLPDKPIIPATLEYVQDTARSTTIGIKNATVQTVEHLMAAIYACNIDNLCIEVNSGEPPISDGSSLAFVDLIEKAGVVEQKALVSIITITEPIYFTHKEIHLVALPSDDYRISYTLHYPQNRLIRSQYYSNVINQETFKKEIAFARTFALYEEITVLKERGLIRGGSLENALVIKEDTILNKEGLRSLDELARHKVLDLIGDLALLGFYFHGHIIAIRSGHATNVAFGKEILASVSSRQCENVCVNLRS